jgi:hypothetical protein
MRICLKRHENANDIHGVQVVASSNLAAPTTENKGISDFRESRRNAAFSFT